MPKMKTHVFTRAHLSSDLSRNFSGNIPECVFMEMLLLRSTNMKLKHIRSFSTGFILRSNYENSIVSVCLSIRSMFGIADMQHNLECSTV